VYKYTVTSELMGANPIQDALVFPTQPYPVPSWEVTLILINNHTQSTEAQLT